MTKKDVKETTILKLDTEDYIQQLERKIKILNNTNRKLKEEKQRIVEINMKIISDLENKVKELENKIEGQECLIETQMHNEEVYEELVKKLEKELNDLKRDFGDIDHECDRLEKIDVEKDLKIEKLENKIKELKVRKQKMSEEEAIKIVEELATNRSIDYKNREAIETVLKILEEKNQDKNYWQERSKKYCERLKHLLKSNTIKEYDKKDIKTGQYINDIYELDKINDLVKEIRKLR